MTTGEVSEASWEGVINYSEWPLNCLAIANLRPPANKCVCVGGGGGCMHER